MSIDTEQFRIDKRQRIELHKWQTIAQPYYQSKQAYQAILETHVKQLNKLQTLLYAQDRHSLLLIFQAMDSAGKDGAIKHVMSGINPQGCQVFSFKHPSLMDLDHDFLWRTTTCLPERGRIGIFNRSYYEDVLIVRVHPEILHAQRLPPETLKSKRLWQHRFRSIRDLEKHLHRNGTRIVKFFLHISPEEQRRRLLERIDDPTKNWKFSAADLAERSRWREYMEAYADCLGETGTRRAPWYIVPADDKHNARLIISQIVVETLKALNMSYPETNQARQSELAAMREALLKDDQ